MVTYPKVRINIKDIWHGVTKLPKVQYNLTILRFYSKDIRNIKSTYAEGLIAVYYENENVDSRHFY